MAKKGAHHDIRSRGGQFVPRTPSDAYPPDSAQYLAQAGGVPPSKWDARQISMVGQATWKKLVEQERLAEAHR